jgi:pyruvate/2-oxoacid:ferredoxin oxidoreductase beta subunit
MRMSVFYERFDRHAGGKDLKGQTTHYCPGCGHGLVHRYLAEAIEELGIQDRTVAISPVGCAVFLYYYLDVGNTQAAHGRAPAVAIGQKLAHPESIVVTYQGDGDLASIGLAEIMQAAQIGLPITVIFVNNAIYGMTGGQMAPTTLLGQQTSTTPVGRSRSMGEPLRIAELMAGLDGPVYVERVALYDNKQRVKARKAIKRGLQLQVDRRGFALIEVLAECPLHLDKTPRDAECWVRDEMTKVFPLGVKKDATAVRERWPEWKPPGFDGATIAAALDAGREPAPRMSAIASELGRLTVKNIVALGALAGAMRLFPRETFLTAIREALRGKRPLLPLNERAFDAGMNRSCSPRAVGLAEAVSSVGDRERAVRPHRRLDPVALAVGAFLDVGDHVRRGVVIFVEQGEVPLPDALDPR